MTREELKQQHYTTWCDLEARYNIRTVKDVVTFEDALDGFLDGNCWGKWTEFDATYTRELMLREWRAFLSGIWYAMNN